MSWNWFNGSYRMKKILLLTIIISLIFAVIFRQRIVFEWKKYQFEHKIMRLNKEFSQEKKDLLDKEWVKKKLKNMFDIDQLIANFAMSIKIHFPALRAELNERLQALDNSITTDLKEILSKYHWITISEFGVQADQRAWLFIQHADRHPEFQKEMLDRLEKLAALKETMPEHYAYLYDRIARNEKRPQRYGTQGNFVNGEWVPSPIEQPELLDERRKALGMMPMEDYIKQCKAHYSAL